MSWRHHTMSLISSKRCGNRICIIVLLIIMSEMASQITDVSVVYSTVCWGADQRNHQSSASLAFVRGIHRSPVNSPHKRPVPRKMFPFDDVIMPPLKCCEIPWDLIIHLEKIRVPFHYRFLDIFCCQFFFSWHILQQSYIYIIIKLVYCRQTMIKCVFVYNPW